MRIKFEKSNAETSECVSACIFFKHLHLLPLLTYHLIIFLIHLSDIPGVQLPIYIL